jgi:hypothetical protein
MEFLSSPCISGSYWLLSARLIGLSSVEKSNSVVQLVLRALYAHQAGKALIPPDSRWLLRFSTRSPGEELQRLIAAEKFHATSAGQARRSRGCLARNAT